MLGISVLVVLWLWVTVFAWRQLRNEYDSDFSVLMISLIALVVAGLLGHPAAALTNGLLPEYSSGERIGYLTKASTKGIIWKTNEVEMQVGTGEMSALQSPHPLSVPDAAVFAEINQNIGRKARVHYSEWLVQPWSRGESGYEVTRVEWLDDTSVSREER